MRLITERINCEVKYKKISETTLVRDPVIVERDGKGNPLTKRRVFEDGRIEEIGVRQPQPKKKSKFHYGYFDPQGNKVEKKDIQYHQLMEDGTFKERRKFKRTSEIKTQKPIPMSSVFGNFLVESIYELFHPDEEVQVRLYEEAEEFWKEDQAEIALFSWGGWKQLYCIVFPIMRDGKFVWLMMLTRTQLKYQYLMPTPDQKIPTAPTMEPLTLEILA